MIRRVRRKLLADGQTLGQSLHFCPLIMAQSASHGRRRRLSCAVETAFHFPRTVMAFALFKVTGQTHERRGGILGRKAPRMPRGCVARRCGLGLKMARLEGFEPPTRGLEGRCSVQLSYRRKRLWRISQGLLAWRGDPSSSSPRRPRGERRGAKHRGRRGSRGRACSHPRRCRWGCSRGCNAS